MELNELELLLQKNEMNSENIVSNLDQERARRLSEAPLKAEKSANMRDFIKMVSKVVSMAMRDLKVEFMPDEGKRIVVDPEKTLDHPVITYRVISRTPKKELKAREREGLVLEETHRKSEGRKGTVYGQKFKAYIQFDIVASEYSVADEVMDNFEDLILNYTHFFKKNGVAELLFEKHYTDENLDMYRQSVSVRSLQYYVELEKLTMVYDTEIQDIQIN